MAQIVDGLAGKPYLGRSGEIGVEFTSGGCEYEDVFSDELSRLPSYKNVDFTIELNPGHHLFL